MARTTKAAVALHRDQIVQQIHEVDVTKGHAVEFSDLYWHSLEADSLAMLGQMIREAGLEVSGSMNTPLSDEQKLALGI